MSTDDLAGRVASLTEREQEQLLQAVTDRLLEGIDEMVATDEDSARELLADLVSEPERPVNAEEVIRPSVELESYVASTLALLASDPDVGPLVRLERSSSLTHRLTAERSHSSRHFLTLMRKPQRSRACIRRRSSCATNAPIARAW